MSRDTSEETAKLPEAIRLSIEEARLRFEERRAEAEIEFHRAFERLVMSGNITEEEIETLLVEYASTTFFAYAKEVLASYADAPVARRLIEGALPKIIDWTFLSKHQAANAVGCQTQRKRFHKTARFMIAHSDEWLELQFGLAESAREEREALAFVHAAERATIADMPNPEAPKTDVMGETPPTEPRRRRGRGRPRTTQNLHLEVEEYLQAVSKFAKSTENRYPGLQRDIIIRDFCTVAGFGDDTVFGAWRSGNTKRCQEAHARRFEAVLKLSPAQFLDRLHQRGR